MSESSIRADETRAVRRPVSGSVRRWVLAGLGIVCVGVGAIGAVVPGLPTTIFLIAACYLFAKSFPQLEEKLVRHRYFSAFHPYLDGTAKPTRRAKAGTLMVMWLFITISTVSLLLADRSLWLVAAIPVAGLVGTWFVAFRR